MLRSAHLQWLGTHSAKVVPSPVSAPMDCAAVMNAKTQVDKESPKIIPIILQQRNPKCIHVMFFHTMIMGSKIHIDMENVQVYIQITLKTTQVLDTVHGRDF